LIGKGPVKLISIHNSGWWSIPKVGVAVWCLLTKTEPCGSVLADNQPGVVQFREGGSPGVGVRVRWVGR
jgi:hypothetical protein